MGTTTIHFPDDLLSDLDRAAARHEVSRNRYVVEACRSALSREAGSWPEGFFVNTLSEQDSRTLADAVSEMQTAISAGRGNRGVPLL